MKQTFSVASSDSMTVPLRGKVQVTITGADEPKFRDGTR
jgi:hypothetical protein